jgi:hypothetical protein
MPTTAKKLVCSLVLLLGAFLVLGVCLVGGAFLTLGLFTLQPVAGPPPGGPVGLAQDTGTGEPRPGPDSRLPGAEGTPPGGLAKPHNTVGKVANVGGARLRQVCLHRHVVERPYPLRDRLPKLGQYPDRERVEGERSLHRRQCALRTAAGLQDAH